jgi:hypothetical protein
VSVPEDQFEEAKAVAEDLAYLADEWKPRLEPAELRRLSPVLRRLLVEGAYGRAWRSVGLQGEPYVSATDLDAMLGALDRSIIHTAFAPPGSRWGDRWLPEASCTSKCWRASRHIPSSWR